MSHTRKPPLVTGVSPNEGIAWTKVTIRGENLGTGPTDLIGKFFLLWKFILCTRRAQLLILFLDYHSVPIWRWL